MKLSQFSFVRIISTFNNFNDCLNAQSSLPFYKYLLLKIEHKFSLYKEKRKSA